MRTDVNSSKSVYIDNRCKGSMGAFLSQHKASTGSRRKGKTQRRSMTDRPRRNNFSLPFPLLAV